MTKHHRENGRVLSVALDESAAAVGPCGRAWARGRIRLHVSGSTPVKRAAWSMLVKKLGLGDFEPVVTRLGNIGVGHLQL